MKISGRLGSMLVSATALAALSLPAINLPAYAQAPAAKLVWVSSYVAYL